MDYMCNVFYKMQLLSLQNYIFLSYQSHVSVPFCCAAQNAAEYDAVIISSCIGIGKSELPIPFSLCATVYKLAPAIVN